MKQSLVKCVFLYDFISEESVFIINFLYTIIYLNSLKRSFLTKTSSIKENHRIIVCDCVSGPYIQQKLCESLEEMLKYREPIK